MHDSEDTRNGKAVQSPAGLGPLPSLQIQMSLLIGMLHQNIIKGWEDLFMDKKKKKQKGQHNQELILVMKNIHLSNDSFFFIII